MLLVPWSRRLPCCYVGQRRWREYALRGLSLAGERRLVSTGPNPVSSFPFRLCRGDPRPTGEGGTYRSPPLPGEGPGERLASLFSQGRGRGKGWLPSPPRGGAGGKVGSPPRVGAVLWPQAEGRGEAGEWSSDCPHGRWRRLARAPKRQPCVRPLGKPAPALCQLWQPQAGGPYWRRLRLASEGGAPTILPSASSRQVTQAASQPPLPLGEGWGEGKAATTALTLALSQGEREPRTRLPEP